MSDVSSALALTPMWQRSIRAACVHPTGHFIPFQVEDVEQSIPDRFEQQVRMYPDRLAVKAGDQAWGYEALNKMANRVAQGILRQRGEGEEPIALLFNHSVSLLAAILGVLKAGKFYLPLDPSYPHARLQYMLEDSQTALIVTSRKDLAFAQQLARQERQLITIDELDARLPDDNVGLSLAPDTLAAIIFTSGSTAQPKGVVLNHRNVLHMIMISTNDYHLCADDRRTLLASPSSSSAVWGVFGALLTGGALYPYNVREEGVANMATWLIEEAMTIYVSTPTLFRQFASTLTGEEKFPRLRLINVGGEAISKRDVELYAAHFSQNCIFATTLAATETGTLRRYFVDKSTQITDSFVPAGYPVEDKEILLLDEQGQKVGCNQVGEIVVKSGYMSPGYWRRPELSKRKFVPDPEGGPAWLYHTGDLGRMRSDGCLIYMGREDSQVKIRGHRVEIAEIEMALLGLENVEETVVIQDENEPGNERLVAYIVPSSDPAPTGGSLRRALADILPGHMVPSAFVMLETFPLTPGGKVDRRKLPKPDRARRELESTLVAPRTPVESELGRIWAEVLDLDQVGIHDPFLDLGGHSILATQILARVIETFQIDLPLRTLLETPTIAEMAVVITQHQAAQADPDTVARLLAAVEALADEAANHEPLSE